MQMIGINTNANWRYNMSMMSSLVKEEVLREILIDLQTLSTMIEPEQIKVEMRKIIEKYNEKYSLAKAGW